MKATFTLGFAMLAAFGIALTESAAHAKEADGNILCVGQEVGSMWCADVAGEGSGGASDFLGAFSNGKGGYIEYYEDKNGQWWVDHHSDGSTTVGWDEDFIKGPNLGNNSEGAFDKKKRPAMTGAKKGIAKPTYAQAKAKAGVKTATIGKMGMLMPSSPMVKLAVKENALPIPVKVNVPGSGKCMAAVVITEHTDGNPLKNVFSTGLKEVSFPFETTVAVPKQKGVYKVELKGKDGCLDQHTHVGVLVVDPDYKFPGKK